MLVLKGGKDNTLLSMDTLLASPLGSETDPLPTRRVDIDLTPVSLVLGTPMMCYPNSPEEFQLLHGKSGRSHSTVVGQSFPGDVVAAVQPHIQAELQDTLVSSFLNSQGKSVWYEHLRNMGPDLQERKLGFHSMS